MTNLVNSTGRPILPACWTHWYFSNHQPGEHTGAILVTGLVFITSEEPGGRHQKWISLSDLIAASGDLPVSLETAALALNAAQDSSPPTEMAPGLSSRRAVKLDVGGQSWGLQRKRSRRAPSTAEVWGKPRVGRGSAAHPWVFGGDQNRHRGFWSQLKERRKGEADCQMPGVSVWIWEPLDWTFPWNWVNAPLCEML